MRVLLHPLTAAEIADETMSSYDGSDDVVIWEAMDITQEWREGQIVYTHEKPHKVEHTSLVSLLLIVMFRV